MPEVAIRFCVRASDGRTTDIWKCWIGAGKGDVYLTSRPLGQALKLSLHESGQWHIAFDSAKKDVLFPAGEIPATRFLGKWERTTSPGTRVQLGARVLFPWSSPSAADRQPPSGVIWIPSAPENQAVEVLCFLVADDTVFDEPLAGNLTLVGDLRFPKGGGVRLVWRHSVMPAVPAMSGTPKYFQGKNQGDLNEANRMVFWGEQPDGSICFVESRADIGAGDAT